jgi:hypothetical protein
MTTAVARGGSWEFHQWVCGPQQDTCQMTSGGRQRHNRSHAPVHRMLPRFRMQQMVQNEAGRDTTAAEGLPPTGAVTPHLDHTLRLHPYRRQATSKPAISSPLDSAQATWATATSTVEHHALDSCSNYEGSILHALQYLP